MGTEPTGAGGREAVIVGVVFIRQGRYHRRCHLSTGRRPIVATITMLTPTELRERLEELRQLGEEAVLAQSRLRAKAEDLSVHDWETDRYGNAVAGELSGVYGLLVKNGPEDGLNLDDVVERIEDTIGVIDLAIERSDDAS
jgi:hypothetical protein